MHGPSHLILSWFTAEAVGIDSPRERRLVALSGFAPDLDVLAYLGAIVYFGFDKDLAYEQVWQVVHHRYTHGMGFVLLTGLLIFALALRKPTSPDKGLQRALKVAVCSMLASVIHLFSDLVAGGAEWPVYPLWPVSDFAWSLHGSWALGDWPNTLILLGCLAGTMLYAKVAGYSPLESLHYRLDRAFVTIIRNGSLNAPVAAQEVDLSIPTKNNNLRIRLTVYGLLILLILAALLPLGFEIDLLNLPAF
jgi:hypothetical protein